MIADSDFENTRILSHTIKGTAGNLGADELSKIAGELEATLMQKKKDEFKPLLDKFSSVLKIVITSISELENETIIRNKEFYNSLNLIADDKKDEAITNEGFALLISSLPENLLKNLKDAAELGDEDMFKKLNVEIQKFNAQLAKKLESLFSDFEYDKILKMIPESGEK